MENNKNRQQSQIFKSLYTMRFLLPEMEQKFHNEIQSFQKPLITIFILSAGIITNIPIVFSFLSSKDENQIVSVLMVSIEIICLLLSHFAIKTKLQNYTEKMLILLIGFIIFMMNEQLQLQSDPNQFYFGANFLLMLCMFPMMKIKFMFLMWTIPGISTIITFRSKFIINASSYQLTITALIITATLLIFTYALERRTRIAFHERMMSQASMQGFTNILKNVIPDGMIIIKDDNVLFANQACERLFPGRSHSQIYSDLCELFIEQPQTIEDSVQDLSAEKQLDSKRKLLKNYLDAALSFDVKESFSENGDFTQLHGELKMQNDEEENSKPLDIQLGNILWNKERAVLIVINDRSAIKRLNLLKETAAYKDNLLATVSHDLRTPLNGIIGMITIAVQKISDASIKKILELSIRSSHLLLYMINDILDLSQISNKKLRLSFDAVNVWDIVHETIKLVKFQAKNKNLTLRIQKDCLLDPLIVNTDANRVKQILLNLLSNALKFTEKGEILLRVWNEVVDSNNIISFSVKDSGIGIKPEDVSRLFKLFSKLETAGTGCKNTTGVGLGLAISQNLAILLNDNNPLGRITVQSEYGVGSEFKFPLLWRKLDSTGSQTEQNEGAEASHNPRDSLRKSCSIKFEKKSIITDFDENNETLPSLNLPKIFFSSEKFDKPNKPQVLLKQRVLIVDDDQMNLFVESKYLKSLSNFQISFETATNGQDAIAKLLKAKEGNNDFDIVLMDCNMPIMNGLESSRIIKDYVSKGQLRRLQIIAVTANVSGNDKIMCYNAGMDKFLSKPIMIKEFHKLFDQIYEEEMGKLSRVD